MKDTYADGNQPVADSADLGAPRTVHADSRDPQSSSSLATLRRQHVVINGAEIVHRPAFCESGMCAACEINRLRALVDDSTQREADLQLAFNASNDHVGKLIADLTALRASLRAQEPQQNEIQEEKATRVDHTQYPSKPLATAATNEPVPTKKYRSCALRPDAQAFDEIRIVTVPRYKTVWPERRRVAHQRRDAVLPEGGTDFQRVLPQCRNGVSVPRVLARGGLRRREGLFRRRRRHLRSGRMQRTRDCSASAAVRLLPRRPQKRSLRRVVVPALLRAAQDTRRLCV